MDSIWLNLASELLREQNRIRLEQDAIAAFNFAPEIAPEDELRLHGVGVTWRSDGTPAGR